MSRKLHPWVAVAGILSVTLGTALATHATLSLAQSVGVLAGDYGNHAHSTVFPLGLAGLTAALSAVFLYVIHLAGGGLASLPSLARTYRSRIGWRSVAITAFAACLVLVGMETAEQFAAGRFDGLLSAFGSSPGIGLGLILLFSAAGNGLLRALCNWIAGAHARVILAVAHLLRRNSSNAAVAPTRSKRVALATFRYACDIPQALGKRGPPILAR